MNHDAMYKSSFGNMPDKTRYLDPFAGGFTPAEQKAGLEQKSNDYRPKLNDIMTTNMKSMEAKALGPTTGGIGTAGYALVPVYVDPRIVDQSRKWTPLVELIPRVTNQGLTADYNVITAKGAAYTALADAALPETDDTYDRASTSIKYLYSVGRVLGPMQAAMPSYMVEGFNPSGNGMGNGSFANAGAPNAKQIEVLMKARSLKELEENLIINGDASTDATQFSGIVTLQGTTNQTDLSAAALTWDDVEESVQNAFDDGGRPKLAIASSSVVTDLRKIMIDTFNFRPSDLTAGATLPFGIPAQLVLQTMVGPIPVIPSQYLSNMSGAKQIFFLDTDFIEMRVLQDMTYEELARTNDSSKFMLKIYECLIMRSIGFNSFIDNIA